MRTCSGFIITAYQFTTPKQYYLLNSISAASLVVLIIIELVPLLHLAHRLTKGRELNNWLKFTCLMQMIFVIWITVTDLVLQIDWLQTSSLNEGICYYWGCFAMTLYVGCYGFEFLFLINRLTRTFEKSAYAVSVCEKRIIYGIWCAYVISATGCGFYLGASSCSYEYKFENESFRVCGNDGANAYYAFLFITVPYILIMNLYLSLAFTKRLKLVIPKPQERQISVIHGRDDQVSSERDTDDGRSPRSLPEPTPTPELQMQQHSSNSQTWKQARMTVNSGSVPSHFTQPSVEERGPAKSSDRMRDLALRCAIVSWVVFVVEFIGYFLIGIITALSQSPVIAAVFYFLAIAPVVVDSYGMVLLFQTSAGYFQFLCGWCVKCSKRC